MGLFGKNKDKKSSQTAALKILLEHAGTLLYELNTNEYTREIIIGRGMECTWTLDGVDSSASTRHAVISKRKNNFYITDLGSRNGIFFQNKRIKERKLAAGDRISLGECTIIVEKFEEKNKKASQFHRLEYMDAKGYRTTVDINKPQMLIGSAPDCDIIFQNQLISSRHAELMLRSDGSCWIRDLNSRNGTSVNGMELMMDGERMLKDNDVITIAYLEIRFLDAAVEHHDAKLWPAIKTLAITALIIMAGYIAYLHIFPSSEKIIELARIEMKKGDLVKAEKLLVASETAMGAEKNEHIRNQLRKTMQLWKSTMIMWERVRKDIERKEHSQALQRLGSMDLGDVTGWSWPGGVLAKKRANTAKILLDAIFSTLSTLENESATLNEVKLCRDGLNRAISESSQPDMAFLKSSVREAEGLLKNVERTLSDDNELQTALGLLSSRQPDYQAIISRLQGIGKSSRGPVKSKANKVLPAIMTLNRETRRVLVMVDKVSEMDFEAVNSFTLDLPEAIDWATEKNIGSLRRSLIETVERFKDASLQLSLSHKNLEKKGVITGKNIPVLECFLDEANMKALYSFDCLNMPLPRNSRKEPAGRYDELLGIEFFYDYVSNIHAHFTTVNVDELPFKPRLYEAREVILEIEKFFRFANKDENQWFNRGKFAQYMEHCRKILALRNKIVTEQVNRPAAAGSREFIVSRGIAAYLLPDGEQQKKLAGEVELAYSAFKRNILKLNREFNIAMPEEALKIRARIIKTGLPGDSIVKKMWQQRPASGWRDL